MPRTPRTDGLPPAGSAEMAPAASARAAAERLDAEYVLPLRWRGGEDLDELTGYLRRLTGWLPVTVVDGSLDEVFARHAQRWPPDVRHLRPEPRPGANGKVAGVVTGVRAARAERVVVADDDVRYDLATLRAVLSCLDTADLVRPQNVYDALPWHARWDTGRSLLNRALAADYPGTLAVRRSTFLAMGGYDADVLFENLELIRTVRAYGGVERIRSDLFVWRRPPTVRHFLGQRVRQAYDDLAQPWRMLATVPVLPAVVAAVLGRRWRCLGAGALLVASVAESGRRRCGGRAVYPPTAAAWAPLWLLERGVCVWPALWLRVFRGGVSYAGGRLRRAASSPRALRRRFRRLRRPAGRMG